MAREQILVVEDEEDIQELVRYNLEKEGYRVVCADSGEKGIECARNGAFDLVLLDLMLPGMDGLEVCRTLMTDARTSHIPIVMVTARSEETDVVTGLKLGADDYIAKPFSPRVLLARIRTVLRRRARQDVADDAPIKAGDLLIHPGRHEVLMKGRPVTLTYTEFGILRHLAARPGWVFSREQIVDAVKGEDYPVTDRSVDVQMVNLRRKLGRCGDYIETVRGVGYRFREI